MAGLLEGHLAAVTGSGSGIGRAIALGYAREGAQVVTLDIDGNSAAETVNADEGLGFLITQAQTYLQTNKVFVGLVIYSVLGLLADQFVRILERVLLRWRPSYEAV